jgi:hypothetical protein
MKTAWTKLIRFEAEDGRILYGQPIVPADKEFDLGLTTSKDALKAYVVEGEDIFDTSGKTKVTSDEVAVKRILGPFAPADVPILRCVGLNYAKHSKVDALNIPTVYRS